MRPAERLFRVTLCLSIVVALLGCSRDAQQDAPAELAVEQALNNPEDAFPNKPLVQGDFAFNFRALAHNGSAIKLSDFGDAPALVYFCVEVGHPGCEAITLGLRDGWLTLQTQISMVLVVTSQDTATLADYASRQKLPMLLLSDTDGKLRRVFGIEQRATSSYLLSAAREVLHVFEKPGGRAHGQEVVDQINQLGLLKEPYPR